MQEADNEARLSAYREQKRLWLVGDFKALMSQAWGRRLANHVIFGLGRLNSPSFDSDPLIMSRNEGIREMAKAFKDLIFEADSDKYMHMLVEEVQSQQAALAIEYSDPQREGNHEDEF